MQQRVTIVGVLPKLNDIIDDARTHWAVSAKRKKDADTIVRHSLSKMLPIQYPCTMSFEWYVSSNHDPDNICAGGKKSILDSMQQAGKLQNDNQKWILGFEDTFIRTKRGDDKVIVTITEYEV